MTSFALNEKNVLPLHPVFKKIAIVDFKTALFDLDGVVFDTEPIYTRFWGEECRRYHPELPGLEHRIKGQTLQQIFDGYFADVPQEQPLIVERLNRFESHPKEPRNAGLSVSLPGRKKATNCGAPITNLVIMVVSFPKSPRGRLSPA